MQRMFLSTRVRGIAPSPTMTMDAKTKQMIAEGHDVVNFTAGEPDFDTPEHIKQAAIDALRQGFTKYTAVGGTPDLRQAICRKLKEENGLEYQPAQIVVSSGAKHSLYNVFQAICDPGDEVIFQSPYWVSYPEMVKLAGGVPVVVRTTAESGFKMTPDQVRAAITPRSRAIILNSPSNPTGAVYTEAELRAIVGVALQHNLYIVTDEIYEYLIYGDLPHVSVASFGPEVKKQTITVNGMSKAFAMTGWRIGYTASETELANAMSALQGHSTSNPVSISQKASLAALNGPKEPVRQMVAEFRKRRDYMVERLRAIPGMRVPVPEGAFYVFPDVSSFFGKTIRGRTINNSDDLCALLLEEAKVALVPGSGFGAPEGVRLSYATSLENIEKGMDRIASVLRG